MAEAVTRFVVRAPIERVWALLSDMEQVGRCVPGCRAVRVINDLDSEWTVEAQLGPFRRTLQMRAHTTERIPPVRGAFVAEGEDLVTTGSLDLRALDDGQTEVVYRATATARGPVSGLVEKLIASQLPRQGEAFARNVKARLET
jgi:carbon monoxide dehydrogenase subunit G